MADKQAGCSIRRYIRSVDKPIPAVTTNPPRQARTHAHTYAWDAARAFMHPKISSSSPLSSLILPCLSPPSLQPKLLYPRLMAPITSRKYRSDPMIGGYIPGLYRCFLVNPIQKLTLQGEHVLGMYCKYVYTSKHTAPYACVCSVQYMQHVLPNFRALVGL